MSDILCPKCHEPWDMDSLHDEVKARFPSEPWMVEHKPEGYYAFQHDNGLWHDQKVYETYYHDVRREFYRDGCKALTSYTSDCYQDSPYLNKDNSTIAAVYDIMGDDIDGAVSFLEDMERYL